MRKLLLFLIITALPGFAQQYPTTPNLGLSLPPYGVPNWQIQVNGNFTILDSAVGALQVPYQGVWISTYAYTKGQIVTYNGALYMSKIPNNLGNNPSISSASWQFVFQSAVSSLGSPNNTLTVSPMSGNILADINLANTNIWTGSQTFSKLIVTDTTPTFSGIAGASTFCLQISSLGVLSNTGEACGSGGGGGVNPSSIPLPLAFYGNLTTVSPTVQTNTTIGPTWTPGPGQFTTPNVYGWHPEGSLGASTITQNRDVALNQECNPQTMFNGAGMGTNENGDEGDKIWQCELMTQSQSPGIPRIIKLGGRSIRLTHANAYALLPRDFGDYVSTSSGSGAMVGLTIDPTTGTITACQVSGGTGYNPSAYLPVQVVDTTWNGSGASLYATTNGSGVPNACVVELGGANYPPQGVWTKVFAPGADGATANCGSLTGGAFTSTTCTVVTGGNGYITTAPACGFPQGTTTLRGGSIPTVTCAISGGQVTGVTLSGVGSGLTWSGSSSGGPVQVCIGGCIGGIQATNIQPEVAQSIGIAIPLLKGTTLDCEGGTIQADYLDGLANTGELIPLGDPWGNQGESITIKNCNIGGFGDVWFAGPTSDVHLDNVHFAGQPKYAIASIAAGNGSAFGVYMPQVTGNTTITNSVFLGNLGVMCGGQWDSRTGGNGGLGSHGGIDISLKTSTSAGGKCNGLGMENDAMFQAGGSNNAGNLWPNPYLPPTASPEANQYNAQLDLFFEQYIWKSQNSPLTNPEAPNGQGTCYSTLSTVNRAIDWKFGNVTGNASTDPWFPCFRGASDMILVALSRYGFASSVKMSNINNTTGLGRPNVLGSFTDSEFSNFNVVSGRTYTDPYLPPSTKQEGVIVSQTSTTSNSRYGGIFALSGSLNGEFQLGINPTTLTATDLSGSLWSGLVPVNGQASFGTPPLTANYIDCSPTVATLAPGSGAGSGATITGPSGGPYHAGMCGGQFMLTTGSSTGPGQLVQITITTPAAGFPSFLGAACTANVQGTPVYVLPINTNLVIIFASSAAPASTSNLIGSYTCNYKL